MVVRCRELATMLGEGKDKTGRCAAASRSAARRRSTSIRMLHLHHLRLTMIDQRTRPMRSLREEDQQCESLADGGLQQAQQHQPEFEFECSSLRRQSAISQCGGRLRRIARCRS